MSDKPDWKPVTPALQRPTSGVTLDKGVFHQAFDADVRYLTETFTTDDLLLLFRKRAGKPAPGKAPHWDTSFPGTNMARFLIGAGKVLQWQENKVLRARLDEAIDGIEACRMDNGYLHCMPVEQFFDAKSQWSWRIRVMTEGMLQAHAAGNVKALPLIRAHYDWYNSQIAAWPAGKALQSDLGYIGHGAATLMYQSPEGKAEDLQFGERQFIDRGWLKRLAAREKDAIWKDPPRWPHSCLSYVFKSYLEHYVAMGQRDVLDGLMGARELIRDNWQHVGGTLAICEHEQYPPRCYPIQWKRHTGELCAARQWIEFHHMLHRLDPGREEYAGEIERQICNVALAGIDMGGKGFHYHLLLEGRKTEGRHPWCKMPAPTTESSCCELYGSNLIGSLREFIYSRAEDGLYVNLFEPSTVQWRQGEQDVMLAMGTAFPADGKVALTIKSAKPVRLAVRVRIPAWCTGEVPIAVVGKTAAVGKPGTYAALDRLWSDGDTATFALPMAFRCTRYSGENEIKGHERYALEYGPFLLAFVGPLGKDIPLQVAQDPRRAAEWLLPVAGKPLHFTVRGLDGHTVMPYWQVPHDQPFTCFPCYRTQSGATEEAKP